MISKLAIGPKIASKNPAFSESLSVEPGTNKKIARVA
jgi:hypothetical protein